MNREATFANYVLDSVRKDLDFLKAQQYLTPEAYNTIVSNLPSNSAPSPAGRAMPSPAPGSATAPSPAGGAAPPPPSYQASTGLAKAEALYDFTGANPQDLSFRRGDLITVTEYVNNDWWRGSLQGKTGLFPSNYVEKKQTPPPPPPPAEKAAPPPPPPSGGENNSYGGGYPPPPSAGGYGGSPYGGAGGSGYGAPPPAQPYGYPPPPAQQYAPSPVSQGAPPPAVPAAAPPAEEQKSGSKWSNMASKVGGNVANAATWGFGATLGSEAAHSIF